MYVNFSYLLEIDHRLRKAPKPIPNFEAKPLLARLVLPWGTRWESRVLISSFFCSRCNDQRLNPVITCCIPPSIAVFFFCSFRVNICTWCVASQLLVYTKAMSLNLFLFFVFVFELFQVPGQAQVPHSFHEFGFRAATQQAIIL